MKKDSAILLELHYLPCVQYLSKLINYPKIVIEQHEHYIKGGYRNRAYIAAANGPLALSVPLLKGKNQQQDIRSVQIAYTSHWQSEHWASIRSAYGNAPFFAHYAPELAPFYKKKYLYLFDFNMELLQWILKKLRLDIHIDVTSEYETRPNSETADWRNGIHPKAHKQRIDDVFTPKQYVQVFADKHGFLPNLSILDLLFCCGPESILILEDC